MALAFQPLRRQVVHFANRLAYGARAQPYEALSDFSSRLAETPSQETLLPAVADAAGRAVSARRAVASLEVPGAPTMSADWGRGDIEGTDRHEVEVRTGGTRLGAIAVWIPKGRRLRPSDTRLLTALSDQAAVAFRNVAMESQLAGHVAELDHTTRELVRLALEDHRGGRRGPADPRGGHLARGAAAPGRTARASSSVPAKRSPSGRPRTGSTSSWPPPTRRSSPCAS